jgi:hypothetical protein
VTARVKSVLGAARELATDAAASVVGVTIVLGLALAVAASSKG